MDWKKQIVDSTTLPKKWVFYKDTKDSLSIIDSDGETVADIGKFGVVIVRPPWVDRLGTSSFANRTSYFAVHDLLQAIYNQTGVE